MKKKKISDRIKMAFHNYQSLWIIFPLLMLILSTEICFSQVTIGDDGSVDGGFRGSVSSTLKVPTGKKYNGAEEEFTLTVMGGLKTESYNVKSFSHEGEE
jgi:hypothetical protein